MIYTPANTIDIGKRSTKVFLNGIEVNHVTMADTKGGVIEFYTHPYKIVGDELERQTACGDVKVIFK